ncbi:MAG: TolB-like 6-bladed beta-propeller domain-containing protein [Bacteroidales bacterium]|nr:TolB-like 6-bladed beta-propeller domain-containing protein [Bacteroidales bacterium]MCF8337071.1 TolB-like 6-bladed beta-propeller domain-containing protein [Bacteroidales bacterium]
MNIDNNAIGEAISSFLIDSILILKDLKNPKYNFHLINIRQESYIKKFCIKGKGPNEFAFLMNLNSNPKKHRSFNTFSRLDKKIITFDLDSLMFQKRYRPDIIKTFKKNYIMPVMLQNDYFISTGPFKKGRYRLSDNSLHTHRYKYHYPYDPEKNDVSRTTKSIIYQGQFILQPNGSHFAFSTPNCGILEVFKAKENSIRIVTKHHHFNAKYETNKTGTKAGLVMENKMGFSDMGSSKNYLYVLYSGRLLSKYTDESLYGKHILVFNWEGEPIKHYKLDKAVRCISVNNTDSLLYAWAALPEPALLEYSLNH